jgi:hypothetical protein
VLSVDVGPDHGPLVSLLVERGLRATGTASTVEVEVEGDDDIDRVRDAVADLGLPLHRMTTRLTSLDEVFLDRAGHG